MKILKFLFLLILRLICVSLLCISVITGACINVILCFIMLLLMVLTGKFYDDIIDYFLITMAWPLYLYEEIEEKINVFI